MIEVFKDGKRVSDNWLKIQLGRICRASQINKMLEAGYSIDEISRVTGANSSIVKKYLNHEIKIVYPWNESEKEEDYEEI